MSNLKSIVETLSQLKIVEVAELVKVLESEWGVSAAAPVAAAAPAEAVAAKTEFDVILTSVGANRIAVIKEVKAVTGLNLTEAQALTKEKATVKSGISKEDAESIKTKLEAAGATVEVK
jgi:large subunit ribosomal protein L7/L12